MTSMDAWLGPVAQADTRTKNAQTKEWRYLEVRITEPRASKSKTAKNTTRSCLEILPKPYQSTTGSSYNACVLELWGCSRGGSSPRSEPKASQVSRTMIVRDQQRVPIAPGAAGTPPGGAWTPPGGVRDGPGNGFGP